MVNLKHGALFNGIGGFPLAAIWNNIETIWHSEIDQFCNKVMAKHFPNSENLGDIKNVTKQTARSVDIISGGFPCQPFSVAGKRRGKEDDRHLWKEMFRVIQELQPTWVICENVPGIINMELDAVLFDLESEGYARQTFNIPACSKNAYHRRYRIWIIAYNDRRRCNWDGRRKKFTDKRGKQTQFKSNTRSSTDILSDTRYRNVQRKEDEEESEGQNNTWNAAEHKRSTECNKRGAIADTECISQGHSIDDGSKIQWEESSKRYLQGWWESEPGVGRVANGIPNRVDRLKSLGNAIVPQVAYEFFKMIKEVEAKCV